MSNKDNTKLLFVLLIVTAMMMILTACKTQGVNPPTNDQAASTENDREANTNPSKKEPPEKKEQVRKPYIGELELPVAGATGYASVPLELKASASSEAKTIEKVEAGSGFEIMKEEGDWWLVKRGPSSGWLPHQYCFINLPDVIPSIVYDNTNTYSSRFVSSGKAIPNITNQTLYPGKTFNERLGKEEYIMPVLYTMAKKIHTAQMHALKEGNSLKIYEAFRPYSVQLAVVNALGALAKKDREVMAGINTPPWRITWFITNGVSNHQMGYAIDVSLVKVDAKKEAVIGDYIVSTVTGYTEYDMPTPIHELSGTSAIFTSPVNSKSPSAWKNAKYTDSMNGNEAARKLQAYCRAAGLSPLASEWWHFNDLEAMNEIAANSGEGKFILNEIHSSLPVLGAAEK
ncbi:D-alanyl-D-alanine carboxypeptidase family protein [Bacillus sp. B-jedd]|uniref:D-alanyl-D-alanine carboxypeptidase family protein n=1 Tax=Bacillus sp. B-jedd TaxID=1476857 RepID=UPI0005155432|nr:D-alanyl-D-alanine carboxypeptidase family protein [Bacillus sp. B-jedd]CEG28762.1 D-alanyl-D-alanine dipeptidase [Bacillus sp. B-jedd]